MRVATLFFTVLAAVSTVTLAAPVPAPLPAPAPVPIPMPIPSVDIQDLHARWGFWNSVKKAAGHATNIYKNAYSVYTGIAPIIKIAKSIHKRDDEMEENLHRRGELEFEEELHKRDEMEVEEHLQKRDEMEVEEQLLRRDLVESAKTEPEDDVPIVKAPTMRKTSRKARIPRHHRY